jgi:mannose-6-phosphate isomerase
MLYPLKFEPILKDKIWGGTKLNSLFNKASTSLFLGESYELSGLESDPSVVVNGFLAGNTLEELIEVYMGELVGDEVFDQFGVQFPLLFKLIDANDTLSIQVHPNDEVAYERHGQFGKTEMWYVLESEENAQLTLGFNKECSQDEYLRCLEAGTVDGLLRRVNVEKGDVIYIPAGTVHAIGKGIVLAEIQQSSDLTYRIFDYNRKDENGVERELHTDLALDVIKYEVVDQPKVAYSALMNQVTSLVQSDFFTTNLMVFDQPLTRHYTSIPSFVVYMCVDGGFMIDYNGEKLIVSKGETVLIPACIDELSFYPESECRLLEVYIS